MRTVFVNPATFSNPKKKKRSKAKKKKSHRKPASHSAPRKKRRRRTGRAVYVTRPAGGLRRVNAGITPFVGQANPLANPRRKRRRHKRRNPMTGVFDLKKFVKNTAAYGGGAAVGTAANLFGLRRIENDYFRNGVRVVLATVGGTIVSNMVNGEAGGAMAGSTLYPMFAEMAMKLGLVEAPATEVDLEEMGIDLQDIMDGDDDGGELFVP